MNRLACVAAAALLAWGVSAPARAEDAKAGAAAPVASAPLSERALDNLCAFARLYGFVRYFHASDGAFDTEWRAFAVHGAERVERAASAEELRTTLDELFTPIAPTLQLFATGDAPPPAKFVHAQDPSAPLTGVAAWRHQGLGIDAPASGPFRSSRVMFPMTDPAGRARLPDPGAPFVADLGGGVSCSMPISVWVTVRTKTAPPGQPYRVRGGSESLFDRPTRTAAVAMTWAAVRHFWPYFEETDVNWDAALREGMAAAGTASPRALLVDLRAMLARLGDGQAEIDATGDTGARMLPVRWQWAEGRLIVTGMIEADTGVAGQSGLHRGDEVLGIGGRPIRAALEEEMRSTPGATEPFRRARALDNLLEGPQGEEVTLEVAGADGQRRVVTLRRAAALGSGAERHAITDIAPGTLLVRLGVLSDDKLMEARPALAAAKAIVFDMRSPGALAPIVGALLNEPAESPPILTPILLRPNQEGMEFAVADKAIMPQAPRVHARCVFLADERTVGQPERDLLIVRELKLGKIVGETTAGTAGDVAEVYLPAGLRCVFTGRASRGYDGSVFFGEGIKPDARVIRTAAALTAGRDEALERGLEILSSPAPEPAPAK